MNDAERMTTYKLADGERVAGDYSWVSSLDYFDDDDEPNDIIEEVWVRQSVREFKYPAPKCLECGATAGLPETDDGLLCESCAAEYASDD